MAIAARLPIAADRVGACVRTFIFRGIDLTGVTLGMQIRLRPDVPGSPLIDLATVTSPTVQGLRLSGVATVGGIVESTVVLRITEATMKDATKVPYSGEPGSSSVLSYDMIGTFSGDKRRLVFGEFVAVPTTYGSDAATPGTGSSSGGYELWSAATLTFGDDRVNVSIDGADFLAPLVLAAETARDAAEDARDVTLGYRNDAQAAGDAALGALASATAFGPLGANKTAVLRQVRTGNTGPTGIPPTYNSDGTETFGTSAFAAAWVYDGVYMLNAGDIAWATDGGKFTAIYQTNAPGFASAEFIQYNAAGAEVGARPTVTVTATETSVRNIVRATGAVKFVMRVTTPATSVTVTSKKFGVARGEPATAPADTLLLSRKGYYETLANEIPVVVPNAITVSGSSTASYTGGVFSVGPDSGAGATLTLSVVGIAVGDNYTLRTIVTNSQFVPNISILYSAGAGPVIGLSAIPAFTPVDARVPGTMFCEFNFTIPAASGSASGDPLAIRLNEISPTGIVTHSNITLAKGDTIPPEVKPSKAVRDYITAAVAAGGGSGGGGATNPAAFISSLGDSLSEQSGGYSVAGWASFYLDNMAFSADGVSTQTAEQCARRGGIKYPLLQVASLTIPAARTAVAVGNTIQGTFDYATSPITNASNSTNGGDPLPGKLGGIPGVLRSVRDGSSAVIGLDFLRDVAATDGQPTKVNISTPFIPTRGEAAIGQINANRFGNNDIGGDGTALGTRLAGLHQMRINRLNTTNQRYIALALVHGVPDRTISDSTAIANQIATMHIVNDANYQMSELLTDYWLDDSRALSDEEWALLGITPTTMDIEDGDWTGTCSFSTSTGLLTVNSTTSASGTIVDRFKTIEAVGVPRGSVVATKVSSNTFTLSRPPTANLTNVPMLARGCIAFSLRAGNGVPGSDSLHMGTTTGAKIQGFRQARHMRQLGWYTGA